MASTGADWEALQRGLSGQVVLPGEDAYERARPPFIAWFDDIQPWAVVRCATPEDVAETVAVARRHRIRTATRGGGHSFAGYSTTDGLAAGDPGGEVAAVWQGKELLRAVYATAGMPAAHAALERFYRWADGVQVPELSRLARTVPAWEAELLAFHATDGCSNAPTEALDLLVKKVKRAGRGVRSFTGYRLRLLLPAASGGRLTAPQDCATVPHARWRRASTVAGQRR
jgi:Transposase/FAD binding domain